VKNRVLPVGAAQAATATSRLRRVHVSRSRLTPLLQGGTKRLTVLTGFGLLPDIGEWSKFSQTYTALVPQGVKPDCKACIRRFAHRPCGHCDGLTSVVVGRDGLSLSLARIRENPSAHCRSGAAATATSHLRRGHGSRSRLPPLLHGDTKRLTVRAEFGLRPDIGEWSKFSQTYPALAPQGVKPDCKACIRRFAHRQCGHCDGLKTADVVLDAPGLCFTRIRGNPWAPHVGAA